MRRKHAKITLWGEIFGSCVVWLLLSLSPFDNSTFYAILKNCINQRFAVKMRIAGQLLFLPEILRQTTTLRW